MRFSSSAAAKRVVDVVLDCLIVVFAFDRCRCRPSAARAWAPLWVLVSVLGTAGQLVQTALERTDEWNPLGRSLVLRATAVSAAAVCLAAAAPGRAQARRCSAGRGSPDRLDRDRAVRRAGCAVQRCPSQRDCRTYRPGVHGAILVQSRSPRARPPPRWDCCSPRSVHRRGGG